MNDNQLSSSDSPQKPYHDLHFPFKAMGSPCEIIFRLMKNHECGHLITNIVEAAVDEVNRLEKKYSRYKPDSLLSQINKGLIQKLDAETSAIFELADICYKASDGFFDITAGVLGKIWSFYGDEMTEPLASTVQEQCQYVGWEKVQWKNVDFQLPQGMALDFGGIVKEYAVDRCFELIFHSLAKHHFAEQTAFLVNLGGDLRSYKPEVLSGYPKWSIGLADEIPQNNAALKKVFLANGAVATSGTTQRFLIMNGKKYGHILNPKTGMPIENQPASVSVVANNAVHAGMIATIAMTQGTNAREFLEESGCKYDIRF